MILDDLDRFDGYLGVHPLFQVLFSWEPAVPAVAAADAFRNCLRSRVMLAI